MKNEAHRRERNSLAQWFMPPELDSPEGTERALTLWKLSWGTLLIWLAGIVILVALQPETLQARLQSTLVLAVLVVSVHTLNRCGWTAAGSWLLVLGLVLHVSLRAWRLGGLHAPLVPFVVVFVMMAGLLLGKRGAQVTGGACVGIGAFLALAGTRGWLPPPQFDFSPLAMFAFLAVPLGLTLLLQEMISASLRRVLQRANEELRERRLVQASLDLALEVGQIGVWFRDVGSRFIHADMTQYRRHGLVPPPAGEGLLREAWYETIHPADRDEVAARMMQLERGEVRHILSDFRTVLPDGEVRYIERAARLVEGEPGAPMRIVGLNFDVTERKRVMRQLGERVKELELLHRFAKQLQESSVEIGDLPALLAPMIPPAWQFPECCEARVRYEAFVAETPGWRDSPWRQCQDFTTAGGRGTIEVAYTQERPPGDEGPFLKEERAVLESLAQLMSTHIDRQMQREALEQLVVTRTVELVAARDAADAANRAKSDFLANMSHEIRTPLHAIIGLTHLLRKDGMTPAQAARLQQIERSGEHLVELVNDILDLSKVEAGKLTLEEIPFALGALLADVDSMVRPQALAKGLELSTGGRDSTLVLRGDPTRLRQAILNYVGNAIKFTSRGKVALRCRVLEENEKDALIRFEVEDTGIGIPADRLSSLFAPFEQLDNSTSRKFGGTGLGLAITKHFAEMMGGSVDVASTEGLGSTFSMTVRLPRSDEPAHAANADQGATALSIRERYEGRRVLLTEDNTVSAQVVLDFLGAAGLRVDHASDGARAVELAASNAYDIILMDMQMPGMDGVETTQRIRALPAGGDCPIIALTANVMAEDRKRCSEAGMNDFLPKPMRPSQLYGMLLKWLPATPRAEPPPEPAAVPQGSDQTLEALASSPLMDPERVRDFSGQPARYLQMLDLLVDTQAPELVRLADCVARCEREAARALAHSLRGAASMLGASDLQSAAGQLEACLRGADDAGAKRAMLAVQSSFDALAQAVRGQREWSLQE
ncbi:ATP-binding protein [Ramlibacter sp.]|uniref:hybrid sensor histidine kinase/response regulator n=1 Tax=Ramlibacter sp. TaxID=1917967 RepID=UPI003D104A96